LTVSGSTFTNNTAGGGGIFNGAGATTTVIDSTFTGNSASSGGGIFNAITRAGTRVFPGTLTVSASNSTSTNGGGLDNAGTATVSGSTFTGNTAGSGNGGLNNKTGGLLTQFDNQFSNDQPPDVFP
jgi:trimeric autotransporter adhesin